MPGQRIWPPKGRYRSGHPRAYGEGSANCHFAAVESAIARFAADRGVDPKSSGGKPIQAFDDMTVAPVPVELATKAIGSLLRNKATGRLSTHRSPRCHLFRSGPLSRGRTWSQSELVEPISAYSLGMPEGSTPRNTTLDCSLLRKQYGDRRPGRMGNAVAGNRGRKGKVCAPAIARRKTHCTGRSLGSCRWNLLFALSASPRRCRGRLHSSSGRPPNLHYGERGSAPTFRRMPSSTICLSSATAILMSRHIGT